MDRLNRLLWPSEAPRGPDCFPSSLSEEDDDTVRKWGLAFRRRRESFQAENLGRK